MPRLCEPHRGARVLQSAHTSGLFIYGQYTNETSKLSPGRSPFPGFCTSSSKALWFLSAVTLFIP
ncbi:hypothetical protein PILCRDRAFT_810435 [Piloderma croceum F 1598]|uniref:Uncharacterized protein n=1 Tax=Piloderma croceum (strain F 1598) TaxID=765440 RepID=A0A0C3C0L1_PILCF|nr:hypothetical protein PILCRDRAFT_810435 [Piloderma croceum F 1598]